MGSLLRHFRSISNYPGGHAAGHGQGGEPVLAGWDTGRFLNFAYFLVVEHADAEQRREIDDQLNGASRSRRAEIARAQGG